MATVSKPGPHQVLVGDLSHAGVPGKVYTPENGKNLPAIAWGHDWREPVENYHRTLRHLASWGFAVAAPSTETGFVANHRGLAADLESAMQILAGVRLGGGNISIHPQRIGVAGHGMGAGAAILVAAHRPSTTAGVAAVYPADVAPSPIISARSVTAPGLILAPGEDQWLDRGSPADIGANWAGPLTYREMDKCTQNSFSETPLGRRILGLGSFSSSHWRTTVGVLTGWLLATVAEDKKYAAFAGTEPLKGTAIRDEDWLTKEAYTFS